MVTFTFHFHALEKEMATHSSVLAWRIPGMGEPGGLPSMAWHRGGHDWGDLAAAAAAGVVECKTVSVGEFQLLYYGFLGTHISGTIHSMLFSFPFPLWKSSGIALLLWNVIFWITASNGQKAFKTFSFYLNACFKPGFQMSSDSKTPLGNIRKVNSSHWLTEMNS